MEFNFSIIIFIIGAIVEAYTFSVTKDSNKSYGLGWGLFTAVFTDNTQLYTPLIVFIIGAVIEMYTFSVTKNAFNSCG